MTLARIAINHKRKKAGIVAHGRVHWLPPVYFEPLSQLEAHYAAMDSAMRHWQALLDEAERVAREDA